MKRKKPINSDLMKTVEPLTENQQELFRCYDNGQNIVAYGAAGTGKTYKNMVKFMFELPTAADFEMLYGNLKAQETISFWSTSFIRGTTLDRAIIIVDEFQNLNFHELDSIITRVGEDSKIMFCGDATQTDLLKTNEKNGIIDFMTILRNMPSIDVIEFGLDDIVRSGLCKEYLLAKADLNL